MRNILVGAVPSPAGQIDQITYALMYKFMNDLDDKSAAMGGKRSYFTGDYAKYNWHQLMSPQIGAHERLELYRQAIQTMSKNENIPELFRSIYQNAFLPFNSASVLTLFLKEVNDGFSHGDSDDIGDAYEYLLSITGAQGDVGQFRTPRHIIKFIVEAVNPTKDDRVLDPACGTAGFLISAYNHVISRHDGKDEQGKPNNEKRLTADERDKIHHNYRGFDIDPTMVRTSKVNMYLHDFKTPDIINHDSLTSEEYWSDKYDVILANPPFMTPKGGIQPHKKFSVSANRAEVLFVDYIQSHLKPTGRAGIIVPEGIIFQSGKAYKQLRKNLIEDSLYAVVSLPSGVFNPYAGVKTSILLLDKELSRQRDEILFVKIENDGYSLGAQRRQIAGNQFPEALQAIEQFRANEELTSDLAHTVKKSEIAESGDYNLSGDRYKSTQIAGVSDYEFKSIEQIVDTISAKVKIKSANVTKKGKIPVIDQSQKFIAGYTNNENARIDDVPIVAFGDHTKAVKYVDFSFAQGADGIKILKSRDDSELLTKYLYYTMANMDMPDKGYSRHWLDVKIKKIPLPPLEIQRQIVDELDGYQRIIDAAATIVKTYKPTIKINPDWETVKLDKIIKLTRGITYSKKDESTSGLKVLRANNINLSGQLNLDDIKTISADLKFKEDKKLSKNDIFICLASGSKDHIGKVALIPDDTDMYFGGFMGAIRPLSDTAIISQYLYYSLVSVDFNKYLRKVISGANINNLNSTILGDFQISLPSLEEQKQIVADLEAEQKLIDANKKLITLYQQKIKSKIAEVWGE